MNIIGLTGPCQTSNRMTSTVLMCGLAFPAGLGETVSASMTVPTNFGTSTGGAWQVGHPSHVNENRQVGEPLQVGTL